MMKDEGLLERGQVDEEGKKEEEKERGNLKKKT